MQEKPAHLGPQYGAQFADAAVVAAYDRRPPYAAETFDVLEQLLPAHGRRVLDVGCGRGDLAIPMAARGMHVDAVDPSERMLASGRARNGGDAPCLRWLHGPIESAPLTPPYDLATAAESLHWTDWPVALPRIAGALAPGARLVIVDRTVGRVPWLDDLRALIAERSTNRDYAPYVLIDELTSRGLFTEEGRTHTAPQTLEQSLDDYVESFHSRNGFSRDRMTAEAAQSFDEAVRSLVRPHVGEGTVRVRTSVRMVWGRL